MEQHNLEFHIAEYNALRAEVVYHTKQVVNSTVYTLSANAAILAFILSSFRGDNKITEIIAIAAWIPVVLTLVGWVNYYDNVRNVFKVAKYCLLLEQKFALVHSGLGWETYLTGIRKSKFRFRAAYLFATVFAIQLVLAVYVGMLVTRSLHGA